MPSWCHLFLKTICQFRGIDSLLPFFDHDSFFDASQLWGLFLSSPKLSSDPRNFPAVQLRGMLSGSKFFYLILSDRLLYFLSSQTSSFFSCAQSLLPSPTSPVQFVLIFSRSILLYTKLEQLTNTFTKHCLKLRFILNNFIICL